MVPQESLLRRFVVFVNASFAQTIEPDSLVSGSQVGSPAVLRSISPSSVVSNSSVGDPNVAGPVAGIVGYDLLLFGANGIVTLDPNPTFARNTQSPVELIVQGVAG